MIIYFERLGADCYGLSLLKRHTILPESHVADNLRWSVTRQVALH